MRLTSRLWTAVGSLCLVSALLLVSPGVRFVRAQDGPPGPEVSSQPSYDGFVEYTSTQPPPASEPEPLPGPSCDPSAPAVRPRSMDELLAAQMAAIRAARPSGAAGGGDVMVLNGRGYNYGRGPEPVLDPGPPTTGAPPAP